MNDKQVALVTGANKGIGREIARQLATRGMSVLVGSRDEERGGAAVAALREGGANAHLVLLDVTREVSITGAAKAIEREHGRLDVLVNNAGIARAADPPSAASVEVMRAIYATNVFGVVAVTNAMLPLLRKAAAGRVVNMSSSLGSHGLASDPTTMVAQQGAFFPYASSKAALNAFTIRLANELRGTSIKVNSACPGYVATDLNGHKGHRTTMQGAAIAVHLATLSADGPTGGFFDDAGVVPW